MAITTIIGPSHDHTESTANLGHISVPLFRFSIYSEAVEEEYNKMVERWKKDADPSRILIFVSPFVRIHISLHMNQNTITIDGDDGLFSVLSRSAPCCHRLGPEAEKVRTSLSCGSTFNRCHFSLGWGTSNARPLHRTSLSCALLATSLHRWTCRYLRIVQPVRCNPEKRARM